MSKLHFSRLSFVLEVLERSRVTEGRKLLDVGFIGEYAEADVHYRLIDSLGPQDQMLGIDISSEKMIGFLNTDKTRQRQQIHKVSYQIGSIFRTPFIAHAFDVVLALEVFEHLFTPYVILDEIRRILKPGGSFIITYPNPLSLIRLVDFIRNRDLLNPNYLDRFRGSPEHKIFPHPVCMAIYLNEIGFRTEQIEFMKYDLKRLTPLNQYFARLGLTRRFSSYVGLHAVKG